MASQVLSGASNASYTNNTGQNVRLIINYMQNVTSMTWAGVNVTAESTTIGKDIQNITGEFRGAETGKLLGTTQNPLRMGPVTYTYELKLSDKKINLTEYVVKEDNKPVPPPKNPNATYNNPLENTKQPAALIPTQENNTINSSGLAPITLSTDNMNYRPYFYDNRFSGFYNDNGPAGGNNGANIFYVPLTVSRGGNFPVELMLAPTQSFSAVCGAFNAVVIKEDGT